MMQDLNDQNSVHEDQIIEELSEQNLERVTGGVCVGCAKVGNNAAKDSIRYMGAYQANPTDTIAKKKIIDALGLVIKACEDSSRVAEIKLSCKNCEANVKELTRQRGGR